jgi:hypothetical protein
MGEAAVDGSGLITVTGSTLGTWRAAGMMWSCRWLTLIACIWCAVCSVTGVIQGV